MIGPVALDEDYHVHSVFSDGASTVTENVRAARERGLRTICLVDHVRRDTDWVADFVRAVRPLRDLPGIDIKTGLEAKILDRAGRLDLPDGIDGIDGIDLILIADHQFPGEDGPVDPGVMSAALQAGEVSPIEVIGRLIEATGSAVRAVAQTARSAPRPLIAHLFSVLPKMGLDESLVPGPLVSRLADQARDSGALVEVNEKWSCPGARVLRVFSRAGVRLVASTDSHDCADIGSYLQVRKILAAATGAQR